MAQDPIVDHRRVGVEQETDLLGPALLDHQAISTQAGVFLCGMGAAVLFGSLRNGLQARVGLVLVLVGAAGALGWLIQGVCRTSLAGAVAEEARLSGTAEAGAEVGFAATEEFGLPGRSNSGHILVGGLRGAE